MGVDADGRCFALAAKQDGVISLEQALRLGMPRRRVKSRLESGAWCEALPRVYRVAGAPVTWHQRVRAAVLWGGPGTAISHQAAAALWQLDRFIRPTISIVIRSKRRPPRGSGLRVHSREPADPEDLAYVDGLPVTAVARTLVDLASELDAAKLERALDDALVQKRVAAASLLERIDRLGTDGRSGAAVLRGLVAARCEGYVGDSALEARVASLLRAARVPLPNAQHVIRDRAGRHVVRADFAYPAQRIAIQVDSYRWHGGRERFDHDLDVRNRLLQLGWRVLHVTDAALRGRRPALLQQLRALLVAPALELSARRPNTRPDGRNLGRERPIAPHAMHH